MKLFNGTIQTLEKSLNYAAMKNQAISENIANIDTPNYQAQVVNFKSVLNNEISTSIKSTQTDPRHIPFNVNTNHISQATTKINSLYNHNGNNVDADKEMAELAKNQIYYQALVDRLNGKFNSIQTVIRGGS